MKQILAWCQLLLSAIRLAPHIGIAFFCQHSGVIAYDVWRWWAILFPDETRTDALATVQPMYPREIGPILGAEEPGPPLRAFQFVWLMTFYPEFRNLFYHRGGAPAKLCRPLCPAMVTLHIATREIGPGLFIQHGFATIIAAERLGRDCWVNQQVTIGYDGLEGRPAIGDRVRIAPGAKVIGAISIGDDCIVGANGVAVKDLASGSVLVPGRGRVVWRHGQRIDESV